MRGVVLVAAFLIGACSADEQASPTPQATYLIDRERISVSGISSGAYLATQLHVAHSSLFSGAGLIAGGPYWCAQSSMQTALGPCMKGGDTDVPGLLAYAHEMQAAYRIDSLENLAGDTVWIFHGSKDEAVSVDASRAAAGFYAELLEDGVVSLETDKPFIHGFPTLEKGVPCGEFASPYLMACQYDAAGSVLRALHGELQPRVMATGELLSISQPGGGDAEMLEHAYLYVPEACAAGASCGVHVALHGCQQSSEFVGDGFATGAGYNAWAESNALLVLYPQVASSRIAPLNPLGCWDWWGYTGPEYATRDGAQISVIRATIDSLAVPSS